MLINYFPPSILCIDMIRLRFWIDSIDLFLIIVSFWAPCMGTFFIFHKHLNIHCTEIRLLIVSSRFLGSLTKCLDSVELITWYYREICTIRNFQCSTILVEVEARAISSGRENRDNVLWIFWDKQTVFEDDFSYVSCIIL